MDSSSLAPALLHSHSHPYIAAPVYHAHPDQQSSLTKPADQAKEADLSDNMPRAKGTLHFRCTYLHCGHEFSNHDDLITHNTRHHPIILPLRLASPPKSDMSRSTSPMDAQVQDGVPNAAAQVQVKPSVFLVDVMRDGKGRPLVRQDSKMMMDDEDEEEEEEVTVGRATMARPVVKRRGILLERNAAANPGASDWKV